MANEKGNIEVKAETTGVQKLPGWQNHAEMQKCIMELIHLFV